MLHKDTDLIANSEDPDQTAPHLDLHCLPWGIRSKTQDHYGMQSQVLIRTFEEMNDKVLKDIENQ